MATARTLTWDYTSSNVILGQASPLVINSEVSFVDNEAIVTGSNLWKVSLFGSRTTTGLGQRIGGSSQILSSRQASTPLGARTADGMHTLEINGISTTFDLSSIGCGDFTYLCLEFGKTSQPSPPFEFATDSGTDTVISCKLFQCANGKLFVRNLCITLASPVSNKRIQ